MPRSLSKLTIWIVSCVLFLQCFPVRCRAVSPAVVRASDDFSMVAEKAGQWVVNISSAQVIHEVYSPFGNDPFLNQFFEVPSQDRMVRRQSLGSGLILSSDGEILTNWHVVNKADEIKVKLLSGEEFTASVLGG